MKTLTFVFNPKSGKRPDLKIKDQINDYCASKGLPYDFISISELHDHVAGKDDTVVAIGGDGTVHSVAEYCMNHDLVMAIIPRGSGDGFAKHRNLPYPIDKALPSMLTTNVQNIDTARINEDYFVNVAGMGMESIVAERFAEMKTRGLMSYIKAVLNSVIGSKEFECLIEIDGLKVKEKVYSLTVANGSQWGNDFTIAREASMRDGILDLIIIRKPKWFQYPALIFSILSNRTFPKTVITTFKGKNIKINSTSSLWHVDGEVRNFGEEIEIQIRPSTLKLIAQ